jgi:hypothetical protein
MSSSACPTTASSSASRSGGSGTSFAIGPRSPATTSLQALTPQITRAITYLAFVSPSIFDNLRLLDSTPVPCGASRETFKRSELAGSAAYGYCRSHSRFFWGFRLYLLCASDGTRSPSNWPRPTRPSARSRGDARAGQPDGLHRDRLQGLEAPRFGSLGTVRQRVESVFGPARASSAWNAAAPAPCPASAPESGCSYSPSQPGSCTTGSSMSRAGTSPPTGSD